MSIKNTRLALREASFWERVSDWVAAATPGQTLQVKSLAGSLPAFLLEALHADGHGPFLCLMPDADAATYLHSDLAQVAGTDENLLLFPPTGHKPYDTEQVDDATSLIQRGDVLQQLADGFGGLVVTSVEALSEQVPPPGQVEADTLALPVGTELPPEELVALLVAQGFERVEFVEQPGELALRGGILDVFPFAGDFPVRLEFFGDEIDSIREFDPKTQRSVSRLTNVRIVPNLERDSSNDGDFLSVFSYFPERLVLATFDEGRLVEIAQERFDKAAEKYAALDEDRRDEHPAPAAKYLDGDALQVALLSHRRLLFGSFADQAADATVTFETRPQPAFGGSMDRLRQQIRQNHQHDLATTILCDSPGQEGRLFDLLQDDVEMGRVQLRVDTLHEGFEVPAIGVALYTDHQIFNRYHRPTAKRQRKKQGGLSLREILNLNPGDFVVHVDYGIGRFGGLEKIEVRGKQQEAVRLFFKNDDKLYVNVNALYKLHKFTGKEGHQPQLTKLGSGQWERKKARTKKRVKDIARDLIKLYAQRKESRGHAFPADTIWQRELEASFQYEDTPDQALAAEAIKEDMEQPIPMDRLVCGDVGFGKTEVAVRAAFKAVQDGKQVAVLVPTTILAAQHHKTFQKRLAQYPVRVGVLSRFRTKEQQREDLKKLKNGEIDVMIGTHRLVSKDVEFNDLGLLIIDEEQRFGVAVKEKLRKFRVNVDTLTLTATPIPRTLQFSLLGARDLSIIATAPPNRQPIITEIHSFDKDLIRDAILYELSRGGQVFFIHNRVQSIDEMADTLRLLVPDIRIGVAHGQMKPSELERIMMGFIDGKYDVLVSTNIIENGLDIANANTIIINRANRFGLAEMHQLRGRVGRSDQKAFCYLLVPSVHALTREGRQRLQAIEEFSDLGSGFHIAMRDLDIRGAGNMLGGEQSGFIEEIGYETYLKILEEAVQELRAEEFQAVFGDKIPVPAPDETTVEVDADAYIPDGYVTNNVERLNLYRRISEAKDEATMQALREEMHDRFGPVPSEVEHLLQAVELKLILQPLRLPKVLYKNQRLFLEPPTPDADPYFYQHHYHPLLQKLDALPHRYALRETKSGKKLRAIVQDVPDLAAALRIARTVGGTSGAAIADAANKDAGG